MLRLDIDKKWNGRPSTPRERVIVTLEEDSDHLKLTIDAPFYGDAPPEAPAGSTPGLWNHEVVEVFIAGPNEQYLELEFGPYGHFLALSFDGVRQAIGEPHTLFFRTVILKQNWMGTARVPYSLLPAGPHRINATAIHGGNRRRYLSAQPLPGDAPDFHQPSAFLPVVIPGAPLAE